MYKNKLKSEKFLRDLDQSQNLINRSVAEGLSFHKIWLKSINNPDMDHDQSQNLPKCSLSEEKSPKFHEYSLFKHNFLSNPI